MSYKVSVIVPVYNAQDTLKVAINSVINQTIGFENIELILVDDKSTDNSREIITSYSNKYGNIKAIFLEENTGSPSKPRNIGINNATSPYLIFLDSDDEIISDYCETLYNAIEKEKVNVVHCGFARKFLDEVYVSSKPSKETCEVENPLFLRLTMWGVFKNSFINECGIKCSPTLHEDAVFALKAFSEGGNIIDLPNYCGYIYTTEQEGNVSVTHNVSINDFIKYLKGFYILNEYLNENKLNNEKLWMDQLLLPLYMFLKIDGNKEEKIAVLKKYREFELSLNYPNIKLLFKPMDMLNKAIMNEQYNKAIFLSSIASKIYNWRKLKNFIFKHTKGLKKIELDELSKG